MKQKTFYYDAKGKETTPEKAVKAEVVTYSEDGSVLKKEYYDKAKK